MGLWRFGGAGLRLRMAVLHGQSVTSIFFHLSGLRDNLQSVMGFTWFLPKVMSFLPIKVIQIWRNWPSKSSPDPPDEPLLIQQIPPMIRQLSDG